MSTLTFTELESSHSKWRKDKAKSIVDQNCAPHTSITTEPGVRSCTARRTSEVDPQSQWKLLYNRNSSFVTMVMTFSENSGFVEFAITRSSLAEPKYTFLDVPPMHSGFLVSCLDPQHTTKTQRQRWSRHPQTLPRLVLFVCFSDITEYTLNSHEISDFHLQLRAWNAPETV